MRRVLLSVMCLGLLAGCSLVERVEKFGPYRVNVQQGNALDAESIARLKPGMSRSQVRFLLGTPLVVDPFRNDRWDYVYVYYEAGSLVEQKRFSLFFEGDTLARIEGDMPAPAAPSSDAPGTASSIAPQSAPVAAPATTPVTPAAGVQP
jgi:outer membrane protein assembly factor BamE